MLFTDISYKLYLELTRVEFRRTRFAAIQVYPFVVFISLTAGGPQRARLPITPTATLPSWLWSLWIFPYLLGSRPQLFIAMQVQHFYTSSTDGWILLTHVLAHNFLSRCKFSTFTPRQPMVGFYFFTFSHAFRYGSQNVYIVCVCVCVFVCIYKIAHNRAIRPCHPSHSMPLALILPRGDQ